MTPSGRAPIHGHGGYRDGMGDANGFENGEELT